MTTETSTLAMQHLVVGPLQVNCFLLHDTASNEAVLIDPGDNAGQVITMIKNSGADLSRITNTHAHFDHVLAVPEVKKATGATFLLHELEIPVLGWAAEATEAWLGRKWGPAPEVEGHLRVEEPVRVGSTELELRLVPGHSPGSIIFIDHESRRAWIGDTVFAGGIGRTHFPGCSFPDLIEAIHTQILTLPDDYALYPGHGPFTTVGHERATNAFLTAALRAEAPNQ